MAGEGPATKAGKLIDILDHPLLFAIAITFMVVPTMALLTVLFKWLGWTGPAALMQHP